jgi:hypothetical protein
MVAVGAWGTQDKRARSEHSASLRGECSPRGGET